MTISTPLSVLSEQSILYIRLDRGMVVDGIQEEVVAEVVAVVGTKLNENNANIDMAAKGTIFLNLFGKTLVN